MGKGCSFAKNVQAIGTKKVIHKQRCKEKILAMCTAGGRESKQKGIEVGRRGSDKFKVKGNRICHLKIHLFGIKIILG